MKANRHTNGNGQLPARVEKTAYLPPWLQKMEAAVDRKIQDDDLDEIVAAFVAKAKKGDEKAAKFVLEYLMGGAFCPTEITVNQFYDAPPPEGRRRLEAARLPPRDDDTQQLLTRVHDYLYEHGDTTPAAIAAALDEDKSAIEALCSHPWFVRRGKLLACA